MNFIPKGPRKKYDITNKEIKVMINYTCNYTSSKKNTGKTMLTDQIAYVFKRNSIFSEKRQIERLKIFLDENDLDTTGYYITYRNHTVCFDNVARENIGTIILPTICTIDDFRIKGKSRLPLGGKVRVMSILENIDVVVKK